ncbi:MAG: UDP-3-O-(3-hydroxymyristoyl)glucosamine N-acyltransferase [Smithellaceae bacterium]|nr:UDP-3-O-(3-hydroxymyristoyl)glucosamine N-acyltransferase [Smithellaceae bacterium]
MMVKTLREIAELLEAELCGEENLEITGVRGIEEAGPGDITFVANRKYLKMVSGAKAGAVLQSNREKPLYKNVILVNDPHVALAMLLSLYYPEEHPCPKDPSGAFIDPEARVSPEAVIFPRAYVGRGARVERGAVIYPGVFIGNESVIGEDTVIYPGVTIYRRSLIGKGVIIHAGAVIGSDGFGFAHPGVRNLKIPQVGYVQIDDEVEIGANTTIDRGTMDRTWIQRGTKIDNLVMIAHNVVIGENSVIVAQVGLAGSAKLGKSVIVGGQAGIVGHITVGDQVMVAARAGVHKDVPPRQVVAGSPHLPHREWLRKEAHLAKLPELKKTIAALEKRVRELEERQGTVPDLRT